MIIKSNYTNFLYLSIISLLLFFGLYLCFVGGYGSDEDTLPMIHVFEARLLNGIFVSSRFTSYPVSEIGIGFLSYYLGSWAANSATFIVLVSLLLISSGARKPTILSAIAFHSFGSGSKISFI